MAGHQPENQYVVSGPVPSCIWSADVLDGVSNALSSPLSGSEEDEGSEENQVTQEMLEDRLVRLATREVMDLLGE